jgi:hypothetical protein
LAKRNGWKRRVWARARCSCAGAHVCACSRRKRQLRGPWAPLAAPPPPIHAQGGTTNGSRSRQPAGRGSPVAAIHVGHAKAAQECIALSSVQRAAGSDHPAVCCPEAAPSPCCHSHRCRYCRPAAICRRRPAANPLRQPTNSTSLPGTEPSDCKAMLLHCPRCGAPMGEAAGAGPGLPDKAWGGSPVVAPLGLGAGRRAGRQAGRQAGKWLLYCRGKHQRGESYC